MRSFVAIEPPERIRASMAELQHHLHAGRPVPRENLHLTLAFLDDQPREVLSELHDALAAIRVPPFTVTLRGIGTFGGKRPSSLHVAAVNSPALQGLHRRVRAAARGAGIPLPRERFVPHVTIARFRGSEADAARATIAWVMRIHAATEFGSFEVGEFGLYSSVLRPEGAVHERLAAYPLSWDIPVHRGAWAPEDH